MSRTRDDACPGALQVHQAADGALARLRLPGGMLTPQQLETLAQVANRYGTGTLELTARGNIQLRGIRDTDGVAEAVTTAGLLPSPAHERVRNIVASPLSGRAGGLADVRPWVTQLDESIQADPSLSALPGRFMFSIDDGRGDVSGLRADVGTQVIGTQVALLLAGRDTGVRLSLDDAVPIMVLLAQRFLTLRESAWRVDELTDPTDLLADLPVTDQEPVTVASPGRPPVGWIPQDDGRIALGAAVPLGILAARQAEFVAAIEAPVVITPWRSLLICDIEDGIADTALRVLAPLGLVFDENSPWLNVSACVGSPGCERSKADVRAEAVRAVEVDPTVGQVHFVGCERACGSPASGDVVVATDDGFTRLAKTADGAPTPRP